MFKNLLDSKWLNLAARIILGAIFIYASVDKLLNPLDFARIIDGYQILPERIVGIVAAILPFLELICGLLLVFGVWAMPSLVWVGAMLLVFIVGMAQAYARGLEVDCGCFSTSGEKSGIGIGTIIRDLLIVLLWAKVLWYYKKRSPVVRHEAVNPESLPV